MFGLRISWFSYDLELKTLCASFGIEIRGSWEVNPVMTLFTQSTVSRVVTADSLTHILNGESIFFKNNIIRVGYPARFNRVGSWATKYIESCTRRLVMYYFYQVEIYMLKFYNQYNYNGRSSSENYPYMRTVRTIKSCYF